MIRRSLIFAIIALLISGGSAFYSRRLAVQDAKKMKRKVPVVEVHNTQKLVELQLSSQKLDPYVRIERDGYFQSGILIRNVEPSASLQITEVYTKKRGKIALLADMLDPNRPQYSQNFAPDYAKIPFEKSRKIDRTLLPAQVKNPNGNLYQFTLYSDRPLAPGDVSIKWHWADGVKD